MEEYYRERASGYEEIYRRDDPARRKELGRIAQAMKKYMSGRRVLEVACGTGFWTEKLSVVAAGIVGVDLSLEMLELARRKRYKCPVDFVVGDSYCPPFKRESFDACLAGFWFSHVPKHKICEFFEGLLSILGGGSRVFMADNVFVPGVGGELIKKVGDVDSYKLRRLGDGREFLVVKNYYSAAELGDVLSPFARDFSAEGNVWFGDCYWYAFFELR